MANTTSPAPTTPSPLTEPSSALLDDLKIAMVLVLGFGNFLASLLPFSARRWFGVRTEQLILSLGLAAAGGIVISTAFSHLLPDANDAFILYFQLSPSGSARIDKYPYSGLCLVETFLCLLWIELGLGGAEHAHSHGHDDHSPPPVRVDSDRAHLTEVELKVQEEPSQVEQISSVDDNGKPIPRKSGLKAVMFWVAMSLHGIFEGLAIGAETQIQSAVGIMIAMVAHKGFDGFAIGMAINRARFSFRLSLVLLFICASATPLGIAVGWLASSLYSGANASLVRGVLFSATTGAFLYIGVWEVLRDVLSEPDLLLAKLLFVTLGWAGMAAVAIFV